MKNAAFWNGAILVAGARAMIWQIAVIIVCGYGQGFLPTRHAEIDLSKQLCIEQGPVQLSMAIGNVIARAEGIKGVTLTGMHLPCHL